VDAADLNLLVDGATSLPPLITDISHAVVNAANGDKALLVRGGVLKQADISTFPNLAGVTSVGLSMPTPFLISMTPPGALNPVTGTGTFNVTFRDQAAGKVLAGPVSGADTTPAFRVLAPSDVTDLVTVTSTTINFDLGNTFYKSITTPTLALDLTNGTPGQVIKVILIQNSAGHSTVAWNAPGSGVLRWPGGTPPVMSTGPVGTTDIYEFTLLKVSTGPNNYYGVRWGVAFDV
jgi:hypothetical protein